MVTPWGTLYRIKSIIPILRTIDDKFKGLFVSSAFPKSQRICTSSINFKTKSYYSSENEGGDINSDPLDKLIPLDRVHINQTKIIRKVPGILIGSGVSLVKFEVKNKRENKLFDVDFQRGDFPKEFSIKVLGPNNEGILSSMFLEPNTKLKNIFLRINSPINNLISSVYEVKGISKLVIIEDKNNKTMFQILINREFGWSTSCKILSAQGDKKIGSMYAMTNKVLAQNNLRFTIHFPSNLDINSKLSFIGASIILMGMR